MADIEEDTDMRQDIREIYTTNMCRDIYDINMTELEEEDTDLWQDIREIYTTNMCRDIYDINMTDIDDEIYIRQKARDAGFKCAKSYVEYRVRFVIGVTDWFMKNQSLDVKKVLAVTGDLAL